MKVFAIADLHLSFGTDKPMDIFGAHWKGHPERIRQAWEGCVSDEDLVLIPGDISWALKIEDAREDFAFIDALPGKKLIIKGNHDYWWSSLSKVKQALPASIMPLQNTAATFGEVSIAGSRLWIDPELKIENESAEDRKIWERELTRFGLSLDALPKDARVRIIMTHFPPISLDGRPGRPVEIASSYCPDVWVFGHMHLGLMDYQGFNRTIGGTRFEFVSADFLAFRPKLVFDTCSL